MLVKQWIEGHPMFRQTRMEYYRISARFRMCISDFKNLMLYPFIKYHTYCNHQQPWESCATFPWPLCSANLPISEAALPWGAFASSATTACSASCVAFLKLMSHEQETHGKSWELIVLAASLFDFEVLKSPSALSFQYCSILIHLVPNMSKWFPQKTKWKQSHLAKGPSQSRNCSHNWLRHGCERWGTWRIASIEKDMPFTSLYCIDPLPKSVQLHRIFVA